MRAVLLLVALALVCFHGTSAASAAPGVIVKSGERNPFVSSSQITDKADVASQSFQTPGTGPTPDGLSFRRLLSMVGIDPDRVKSVSITGEDGSVLELPRNALREPPPFGPGPSVPPLVWVDGQVVRYVLVSGPRNPAQELSSGGGDPLLIEVEGGESLKVEARADRTKIDAGQSVTFGASVAGSDAQQAEITWDFGDGATATGSEVTHRYRKAGTYSAFTTARSGGALGYSKRIRIQVGDPAPPPKPDRPRKPSRPDPDQVVAPTPSDRAGGPPPAGPAPAGGGSGGRHTNPPKPEREPARAEPKPDPDAAGPRYRMVSGELVASPAAAGTEGDQGGTPFKDVMVPDLSKNGADDTLMWLVPASLLLFGLAREWWRNRTWPW